MTHGSLFSGIGGFDLAAEWAGWENMFHCEWNEFGQKILKYYWPQAITYGDITKTDFTIWRGRIDVLTGGFPCQPFSQAGKRKGTEDDRYLWPEYLRAIREIQPAFVVGENVAGILTVGERTLFAKVDRRNCVRYVDYDYYEAVYIRQEKLLVRCIIEDLEKEGYEVQLFNIPAAGVGAPHKRERIWFVAHRINANTNSGTAGSSGTSRETESIRSKNDDEQELRRSQTKQHSGSFTFLRDVANSTNTRIESLPNGKIKTNECGIITDTDGQRMRQEYKFCTRRYLFKKWTYKTRTTTDTTSPRRKERKQDDRQSNQTENGARMEFWNKRSGINGNVTNTMLYRSQGSIYTGKDKKERRKDADRYIEEHLHYDRRRIRFEDFPTVSPVCNGDDGLSTRLDGITFSKWRAESVKAGGNAVVPQVVYQIFKAINEKTGTDKI